MIRLKPDKWREFSNVSLRGYLLQNEQALSSLNSAEQALTWLKEANGCFAFVLKTPDYCLAAVDRIRSIPLFYDQQGNLSDQTESIEPLQISHIQAGDKTVLAEFLVTGFVSGNETLHPEIYQIPAGHYLIIKKGQSPILKQYYSYSHEHESRAGINELCEHLHDLHLQLSQRLICSLEGRPAVIPLSGGWDSRLIAWLLKQSNYPHIFAFSYDARNNPEARISQKVAKHLDIPWIFIEHSHRIWYEAYFSDERKLHYKYAVNASSSAHIQDWLAVKEMRARKLIPQDSVFIPGHTGDFLQSGHLPHQYEHRKSFSDEDLLDQIICRHYRLWKLDHEDEIAGLKQRIRKTMPIPATMPAPSAASLFESWEHRERQAKFIINSVRVYEDLGYDWRLPLWDSHLMDFWATVPLELRLNRKLWHCYQRKFLPIPIPTFKNLSIPIRVRNKILRIAFGEITDVRYGRFAEFRNPLQYASEKVDSYLRADLVYPGFINASRPLIRCDMNALQALRAIFEL